MFPKLMNLGGIVLLTSRHYNLFFFSFAFSQIRNTKDKICKCVPRNLGTWFCPWLLWNARDKCSRGRAAHTEALWAAPVDELYRRDSLGSGGGWYSKKTSAQKIWGDSPIVLAGWLGGGTRRLIQPFRGGFDTSSQNHLCMYRLTHRFHF